MGQQLKNNIKSIIELYAEQHGISVEAAEVEMKRHFGDNGNKPTLPIQEGGGGMDFLTKLNQANNNLVSQYNKGTLSLDQMFEQSMKMQMMKSMIGSSGIGTMGNESTKTSDINEVIARNDEKWERRLKAIEEKHEKETLQRQLDDMKSLILSSSGHKKDDISDKFEKLNEKLDAEKEKRFIDALGSKSAEIEQLRTFMQKSLEDFRNQPAPKSNEEGFFDMLQKMDKFDSMVRSRGKTLGMTDEQIERELQNEKPMKQQILGDLFKTINRGIDAYVAGKKPESESESQPEIASQPITCGNCGRASTNGTEWCDLCRIQYSNDVQQQQQQQQKAVAVDKTVEKTKGELSLEAHEEDTP